jgi:hypothetical protein
LGEGKLKKRSEGEKKQKERSGTSGAREKEEVTRSEEKRDRYKDI